jgi:hypothetical protein
MSADSDVVRLEREETASHQQKPGVSRARRMLFPVSQQRKPARNNARLAAIIERDHGTVAVAAVERGAM